MLGISQRDQIINCFYAVFHGLPYARAVSCFNIPIQIPGDRMSPQLFIFPLRDDLLNLLTGEPVIKPPGVHARGYDQRHAMLRMMNRIDNPPGSPGQNRESDILFPALRTSPEVVEPAETEEFSPPVNEERIASFLMPERLKESVDRYDAAPGGRSGRAERRALPDRLAAGVERHTPQLYRLLSIAHP